MISNAYQKPYHTLCERCFSNLQKPLGKWRRDFIKSVLWLFLSVPRKINCLQLARYSKSGEQRYRQGFEKNFDFLSFNSAHVCEHCSSRRALAIDPSYIPKSGKKTDGLGKYWSGCAGTAKWGLEICGIAALDLDNHTALHLEAEQTVLQKGENPIDFYANKLIERKKDLQKISKTVAADAYFSKRTFVDKMCKAGFNVVSRLRDDVRLKCLIEK